MRLFRTRTREPQMPAPLRGSFRWQKILLEMPARHSGDDIDQQVDHPDPRRLKMQIPPPPGWAAEHERQRQIKERGCADSTRLAPIKSRVREDDPESADHQ